MGFSRLIDMRKTAEEKAEDMAPVSSTAANDYPYGLCISLTEDDLERLDLDDDAEVGDVIDLRAFARVTSISKNEYAGRSCCRIELQIEQLAVENETTEEPGEE